MASFDVEAPMLLRVLQLPACEPLRCVQEDIWFNETLEVFSSAEGDRCRASMRIGTAGNMFGISVIMLEVLPQNKALGCGHIKDLRTCAQYLVKKQGQKSKMATDVPGRMGQRTANGARERERESAGGPVLLLDSLWHFGPSTNSIRNETQWPGHRLALRRQARHSD